MLRQSCRGLLAGVLVLLASGCVFAQDLDLEALVDEALRENPDLAALRHRQAAFEARVPQSGALSDPVFRFETSNVPLSAFDLSSTPMSGNQLFLSQRVPLPGVRSASETSARAASLAAQATLEDREAEVVNAVKQAYYTIVFLDRSLKITGQNEALLRDLIRIVQTKYAVGRGLQQDVLKAQVSLSGLRDKILKLNSQRRTAEARLNLILHRPIQTPVGTGPETIAPTPFGTSVEELRRLALENRPFLRAGEQTVRSRAARAVFARRKLWPDLTFNLGYRQRMSMANDPVKGSDFLSFGVGLNVPIYRGRKQAQKVKEAAAELRMAEAQLVSARQHVLYGLQARLLKVQLHSEEVTLFETALLPQARQSLESAMVGYQVDKVNFLTLLNNQVTLFTLEIEYFHHLIEREKQLSGLEAVVGTRLF